MPTHNEAVIVAYGRSPICRAKKGVLAHTHPVEWAGQVLGGVLAKLPQINSVEVSDVVVGCARPYGKLGKNVARLIAVRAGLPDSVSAQTINRYCASSLQSIATCAHAIIAGQEDVMIAGGVEAMSTVFPPSDDSDDDSWLKNHRPAVYMSMGLTAENVAARYGITRLEMEQLAVASHARAHEAQRKGYLSASIIPVTAVTEDGHSKMIADDDGIRPDTNLDSMANLKPCFKEDGVVTAATSSQTSDGASFVVLMNARRAAELGIEPISRFVAFAVAGCDPAFMGLGPVFAVPKALEKSGLSLDDMDVVELNEAFAAQVIPCMRLLGLVQSKVNPWGGAIALGHPLGATGAILTCKALDYLVRNSGKYALVTMCIGGGMGAAAIFELL